MVGSGGLPLDHHAGLAKLDSLGVRIVVVIAHRGACGYAPKTRLRPSASHRPGRHIY